MVSFRYLHKNAARHVTRTIGSSPFGPTLSPARLLGSKSLSLFPFCGSMVPHCCRDTSFQFGTTVACRRRVVRVFTLVERGEGAGTCSLSLRIGFPTEKKKRKKISSWRIKDNCQMEGAKTYSSLSLRPRFGRRRPFSTGGSTVPSSLLASIALRSASSSS